MMARSRSRRGFLRDSFGALLAAIPFGLMQRASLNLGQGRAWWHAAGELREILLSPSAAMMGKAYMELAPSEIDESSLVRGVGFDLDRFSWAALERRIEGDFASGRTVRLDGWVLSLTEARLYALAALIQA
jgi:hypothetical protein